MPLRFEAWTRPGSGTFEKKFDIPVAMPGSAGVRELSAYSDESIMVPASYSRLPELVSETDGSFIRVFHRSKIIDEFDTERVSLTAGRPNTRTISGPQRNGLVEGIGILPKGYPNHKEGAFDWKWGAENILPDLGLADLGNLREEWEVWHDHTSGAWNAAVDGDDNDIAFDATASDVEGQSETLSPPGSGLQGLTTVDDVTVDGSGTEDDPYVIVFHNPPSPGSVAFTVGSLSGGTTFSATRTAAGSLDPSPITKSKPVDAGAGSEEEHGSYGDPPIQVVTDNLDSDADWALRVNATDRYAGSQIILDVTPGRTYSHVNVRVKPTASGAGDYTLVIRDIHGNKIKNTTPRDVALTAGSYQDLTIDSVTIPGGVNQVVLRVATTDATLGSGSRAFYVNWQGATFLEGDPEATWTQIIRELLEAGQARGAGSFLEPDFTDPADSLGTALSTTSYTQFVGDNAHLGQALEEGRGKGFQWQVVPAAEAKVITPAVGTTHVLQIYKVDADEIEDLTANPGGPTVTVGAKGVSEAQVVSRRIPYTTLIGLGTGNVSAEAVDAAADTALGTIERVVDVEHLGSVASVQDYVDAQLAEQARNLKAATATVLETASQIPGVDYGPGSKIWWQFPGILDKEARPVKRFSWVHGLTASFRLEGSRILTGESAVVAAVDMLLRRQGRRRDPKTTVSPTSLAGGDGATVGAHMHLARSTAQTIAVNGEAVSWNKRSDKVAPLNFESPSLPLTDVVVQQPGYYDISVAIGWSSFTGGGSVRIVKTSGGVQRTVYPPDADPDVWTATIGKRGEFVAHAIPFQAGESFKVVVDHNDSSTHDLASATLAVYLVDREKAIARRYVDVVMASGPLAYWRLDESSGTTAEDMAGHASGPFDGTYVGSPGLAAAGLITDGSNNPSVDFTPNDHMLGQDWPAMDFAGTDPFTLEAWIDTDTLAGGSAVIIHKQVHSSGNGWELVRNADALFASRIGNGGADIQEVTSGSLLATGRTFYVAVTYDGAELKLYVDGNLVDSDGTSINMAANTETLDIGFDTASGNSAFDGRIDEVAVYDRAVSAAEIVQHYNVGRGVT